MSLLPDRIGRLCSRCSSLARDGGKMCYPCTEKDRKGCAKYRRSKNPPLADFLANPAMLPKKPPTSAKTEDWRMLNVNGEK
jgi:hypothetical protein